MATARITVLLAILLMAVSPVWGQESTTAPQAPDGSVNADKSGATKQDAVTPDTASVNYFQPGSGALPFGLGTEGKKQLDITLSASQSWDSNGPSSSTTTTNSWEPVSSFGGSLQLSMQSLKSQTLLNYYGNGLAYPDRNPVLTTYQNLGFSQSVRVGRWGLTVADAFNYSPNSPFGGYAVGLVPPSASSDTQVLKPQYVPNQSILTTSASNYFNSVLGQVEYGLSRRSSVTGSVSYGLLQFFDSGFYDTNQVTATAGYNYSLSARNSISFNYTYSQFHYTSFDSNFTNQTVQLSYSHLLPRRLSYQIGGGVQFVNTSSLGVNRKRAQFSGSGSLVYNRARTNLTLSYFAGATGGSGALTGANTQNVQFSVGYGTSNKWTSAFAVGYSRNSGLVQQQSYNAFYVSPSIRRAVTRNLGVSFNYSYQHQVSSTTCVGAVCGNLARNFLSVGVDYRFRPIRLE